jgi:uncharacterized membrane protein YbaN (DUF454 family)
MTTKNWIIGLFSTGFAIGFLIVGMALMASSTDKWYNEVTNHPHYRAMLVDYAADGDTVMMIDISGDSVKVTHEP